VPAAAREAGPDGPQGRAGLLGCDAAVVLFFFFFLFLISISKPK
jgi:hypothetical protein